MVKKRSVKQKAIERAKWSDTFRDGFNHGYSMGYAQAKMEIRKGEINNDNQVDKMDRQDDQETTWSY
jgi:hypothetical protein